MTQKSTKKKPMRATRTPKVTRADNPTALTAGGNRSVSDVLTRAAELVERGWCQHRYRDGNCFCASGAIIEAIGTIHWSAEEAAVRQALRVVLNEPNIGRWNDAPQRTQAEVVAKLREAAALAAQVA